VKMERRYGGRDQLKSQRILMTGQYMLYVCIISTPDIEDITSVH